jgi:hypothetical protein
MTAWLISYPYPKWILKHRTQPILDYRRSCGNWTLPDYRDKQPALGNQARNLNLPPDADSYRRDKIFARIVR